MRYTRFVLFVAGGALIVTGCSSGQQAGPGPSGSPSGTPAAASSAASPSSTPSSTPSSPAATSSTPPSDGSATSQATGSGGASAVSWCTTSDLRVRLRGGDGAMGTDYYRVLLTNTSTAPCRTGGYGGVSLVGDAGRQIGRAAVRDHSKPPQPVTLQPGQRARDVLSVTVAQNYPTARCRPAPARGFRVYPPDETHSVFLPRETTGCRNLRVALLRITPYRKVRG